MKANYKLTCNLLVEPEKPDRFYMDMRVYSVVPFKTPDIGHDPASMVWRGIYLAYRVDNPTSHHLPSTGPDQRWS